ncbi:hypothetical protein [Stenotrophomonas cyclobalanopsidis]
MKPAGGVYWKVPSRPSCRPSGAVPDTVNTAPTGALSLLATLPESSCPAGVENTSATAVGATTRRICAESQLLGSAVSHNWYVSVCAPDGTPASTFSTPLASRVKPDGAPTRLSSTSADAGGWVPLRLSLSSTDNVLPPPAPIGVARKSSSPATRVPALTLRVTVAPAHTAPSGAGRQAW